MIHEGRVYVAEHGVAVATTWSPTTVVGKHANTFSVTSGKTAGIIEDDGDRGVAKAAVDMASIAWGLQHAPRGGERVVIIPTETSPIALNLHGDDDSCATLKPGETILRHFNAETAPDAEGNPGTGTVNTSLLFANDAASTGDNLGQIAALAGGLLSLLTTAGYGITVTDSSGNIVVTANTVQIAGSGTNTSDAVVRQSDLVTLLSDIQSALATWASTSLRGGTGAAGPTTLTSITPTASAVTFTA